MPPVRHFSWGGGADGRSGRAARRWGRLISLVLLATLLATLGAAQDSEPALPAGAAWRVRLLAPLTTKFNRKGDIVSARVVEPAAFQEGILEGVIRDLKAAGGAAKVSTIQFDFITLHLPHEVVPVTAALVEALNSRRESGVDDDGSPLEFSGRSAAGKPHGGSGVLRLTAKSAHISFAPGSEFVLQLQVRKVR